MAEWKVQIKSREIDEKSDQTVLIRLIIRHELNIVGNSWDTLSRRVSLKDPVVQSIYMRSAKR